ncbi:leukocyte receptor cluster member 1 homolog [Aplysia californica]|uniref:Leukocyte receptor cluster member 1 homolog n=1 Tax=Aplysia californica TaxID=6500 RepID=A0ABM1AD25_APLCA|nr:leukocyte receptor cluster member 1 homolog [Aplysia californica]
MNILPHKSWHVRTKKNIERVRRDEEKAAEEEKERQRRIALAEQEARTDLLRARAHGRALKGNDSSLPPPPVESGTAEETSAQPGALDVFAPRSSGRDVAVPGLGSKTEHVNFFKDIEDGLCKQGKNKEHEAEKKKEQEALEKKIGLLTYLGQTALDEKEAPPWYMKKSHKKKKKRKSESESEEEEEDKEKKLKLALEEHRRRSLDPLLEMREIMSKSKKKHKKHKTKERGKDHRSRSFPSKSSSSKRSSSPVRTGASQVASSSSSSSSKKTIEQLRAERMARERQEKARAQVLVNKHKDGGDKGSKEKEESSSDSEDEREKGQSGKRRYNSQYNPEFISSQPRKRRRNALH